MKVSLMLMTILLLVSCKQSDENSSQKVNVELSNIVLGNNDYRYQVSNDKEVSNKKYMSIGIFGDKCTGTVIGDYEILTAAHCVYDLDTNSWFENNDFSPAVNDEQAAEFNKKIWKEVYIPKQYIEGEENYDIAVIKLNEPIPKKYPRMKFDSIANLIGTEVQTRIAGYPGDKENGTLWNVNCKVNLNISYTQKLISHECDTVGGMSGAVLITKQNNGSDVIYGVHVGSELTESKITNIAVFITHELKSYISSWVDGTFSNMATTVYKNKNKQKYIKIVFYNKCDLAVRIALRSKTLDNGWKGDFWYVVGPDSYAYIEDTKNRIFYFYAESVKRHTKYNRLRWKGSHSIDINGREFGMHKLNTGLKSFSNFIHRLSCDY